MKTYLITGGYGFIGSNYILNLVKNPDIFVINLDSLTYASNLKYLKKIEKNSNYKFIKGDICDSKLIESLFKQYNIDVIVHFAAESHVDRSYDHRETFVKTNIYGTINLLDTVKKYWKNKNNKRFIYISTDEIYGSSIKKEDFDLLSNKKSKKQDIFSLPFKEFKEYDRPNPSSPYSNTKACADLIALYYAEIFDLPIIVCRPTNNYGKNQHPEKLIPQTILTCFKNEDIVIHGEGKQLRDFLHVNDNINAINLLIEKGKPGEAYNICAKNEISVIEIINKIITFIKQKYNPTLNSKIITGKDRENQDYRYSINCDKIKELGFKTKANFDVELFKLIDFYYKNIDLLLK